VGVLGMEEQMRLDIGGGEHEVVLGFPGAKGSGLLLVWADGRTQPYELGDGYSRFVIRVSDVDRATAELAARGVTVTVPPTDAEFVRYSMIRDPDGYLIELLQVKKA